jgi:hypothetical protein
MPSLNTSIKQTPSSTGYFLAKALGGSFTARVEFIYDPIAFTVGSFGVVGISGTNVYFDTYANVVSFFTDPGSNGNTSFNLGDNELYRDMGKTYNIYVQQTKSTGGYYYDHVLTLSKAQRFTTDGQTTDGVVGGPTAGNRLYYFTGYIVTWSANPTVTGIPVGVSRVGFQ